MDAPELWETTLDPTTRNILQVTLTDDEKTDETMDMLLNNNSKYADQRKVFLLKNQDRMLELEVTI
jgi:topoisomerase-4 subunit B